LFSNQIEKNLLFAPDRFKELSLQNKKKCKKKEKLTKQCFKLGNKAPKIDASPSILWNAKEKGIYHFSLAVTEEYKNVNSPGDSGQLLFTWSYTGVLAPDFEVRIILHSMKNTTA